MQTYHYYAQQLGAINQSKLLELTTFVIRVKKEVCVVYIYFKYFLIYYTAWRWMEEVGSATKCYVRSTFHQSTKEPTKERETYMGPEHYL